MTIATQNAEGPRAQASTIILDRWHALKRSRIRAASSSPSTRASSIGHPCERFLYYERTQGEARTLHDEGLQSIFDMGNLDESFVLRELEEAGITVVQRGRDFRWPEMELSGHIDARLEVPGYGRITAEIKSMAPWIWDAYETLDDVLRAKHVHVRKYYDQVQTYMLLEAKDELSLFLFLNKSTGRLRVIEVPLDYAYAEGLLRKAERIRDAVRKGVEPARLNEADVCARCAFAHVCLPDLQFGPGLLTAEREEEAVALLERREGLRKAKEEYEEADDALKALLPREKGEYLVGEWLVTNKEVERKAFTVKASKSIRQSITKLTK